MRLFLVFAFIGCLCNTIFCQAVSISLNNGSFEDIPRHSHAPIGWKDCGFLDESPPDIQPSGFSVNKKAVDGKTYLGLVVRDNDTWEGVSQQLSQPLEKGKCYEFSIFLARSELYVSPSQITGKEANYTTPAKLRIYGGFGYCDKQYLLGETALVINTRWIEYSFKFEPIGDYTHLLFEAFYKTPTLFPYNGNILLDNASTINMIPCDETDTPLETDGGPIAEAETEIPDARTPIPDERTKTYDYNEKNTDDPVAVKEAPEEKDTPATNVTRIGGFKREELRRDQVIRIEKLFFEVDASEIQRESFGELNNLFEFLSENGDVVVEIGGHTNSVPTEDWYCDSLSTARAKAVADYLVNKGIATERLQFKGYGKRKPLYSNRTEFGRRKNQRVEIKILSIG